MGMVNICYISISPDLNQVLIFPTLILDCNTASSALFDEYLASNLNLVEQ